MLLFPLCVTPKLYTQTLTDLCSFTKLLSLNNMSPQMLWPMGLCNDYENLSWVRAHVIFCKNHCGIPRTVSKPCAG